MQFSAGQIADYLKGSVEGSPQVLLHDIAKIEDGRSGTLCFLSNLAYAEHLYSTKASAVLVAKDFIPSKPIPASLTLIRVADPRAAFAQLLAMHDAQRYNKFGYEQPSYISPSAVIGKDVYIGAFSYIADGVVIGDGTKIFPNCYIGESAKIGAGCKLHAGVRVYGESRLGERCIVHANTVIGADGFGFTINADGSQEKMAQIGNVVIEDDVEIGANCTIDRATLGSTYIRTGAKLDNLVQIGHNADIGAHCVLASQVGVAGSTVIGPYGMYGGQVGIAGHITVGERVRVAAQTGIAASVPDNAILQGSPAIGNTAYKRSYVHFRKLPELAQRVDKLEGLLKALHTQAPNDLR